MKSRKAWAAACRSAESQEWMLSKCLLEMQKNLVKTSHRGPESTVASTNDFAEKGVRGQACPRPKPQALGSSSQVSLALLLTSATKVSPSGAFRT